MRIMRILTIGFILYSIPIGQTYDKRFVLNSLERMELENKVDSSLIPTIFSTQTIQSVEKANIEYSPIGIPGSLSWRSGNVSIPFSQLMRDKSGEWIIGQSISGGLNYLWLWGNGTLNEDSSVTVEPHFFFGPTADIGLGPTPENSGANLNVKIGGIIGFSQIGILISWDMLNLQPYPILGIATKIENLPLLNQLTSITELPRRKYQPKK